MLKRTITVLVLALLANLLGVGGIAGTAIFIISSLVSRPEGLGASSEKSRARWRPAPCPVSPAAAASSQRERELRHEGSIG